MGEGAVFYLLGRAEANEADADKCREEDEESEKDENPPQPPPARPPPRRRLHLARLATIKEHTITNI